MTIVIAMGGVAAVIAVLVPIVAASTTLAVTDNNNTDGRAGAVENDSSRVVAADGPLTIVKVQNLESTLPCVVQMQHMNAKRLLVINSIT